MEHHTLFVALAIIAICSEGFLLFLALFNPGLRYKISSPGTQSLESDDFCRTLEALTDAKMRRQTQFKVLTNGDQFYEAMLEAIRQARRSVNLECYIFQRGKIAERFVDELAERARAGIHVNVVLDGLGSLGTTDAYLKPITSAGGKIAWYHPLRWNTWPRYNNRTHRELLVVDGEVAFIGGAGIADHWYTGNEKHPRWRDTVLRLEGESVLGLQGTFAENWLESCGEILTGEDYFPNHLAPGNEPALIINSAPSPGGSSRARVLFQTLVASARKSIYITTPYFLPDESLRRELVRQIQRGVEVIIVTPGRKSDHALTRNSSRRLYGELLRAGARVFEYQPAMIHAKVLIIDSMWIVVGSTNCDNRSFGINDEVNLAAAAPDLALRLEEDFRSDIANSREISLRQWSHRPVYDRVGEMLGWIFERQQ
jgi:cardiolipin synthase A/B